MKPDDSWILEVLSDIRTYALENDLPVLAEQLDNVAIVALTEIAERTDEQGLKHSTFNLRHIRQP